MSDAPPANDPPRPRKREFEDPHYHDDDELPDDGEQKRSGSPGRPRKPTYGIPPPRRRHYED
jgi:hypothetical protein